MYLTYPQKTLFYLALREMPPKDHIMNHEQKQSMLLRRKLDDLAYETEIEEATKEVWE